MKSGKLGTLLLLEAHLLWLFALSVQGHDNGECTKVCVGHRHKSIHYIIQARLWISVLQNSFILCVVALIHH